MPPSKSARNAVKDGLKRLMRHRVDQDGHFLDVFPYSPLKGVSGKRDPKDDAATALLSTSILEQSLEHAISSRLVREAYEVRDQVFDGEAAILRDLFPKIGMAYMLGILGNDTKADLNIIRQIRNVFAHSRSVLDFDTPEVAAASMTISLPDRMPTYLEEMHARDPRERFIQSVFGYSLWLFTSDLKDHETFESRASLQF